MSMDVSESSQEGELAVIEICPAGGRGTKVRIRMEGAEDFCLYRKEADRLKLHEGAVLSAECYEEILQEILLPRARKRALHLLEKQDRSRNNLTDKLLEGGYPRSVVQMAVAYVESYHYVDDTRYARDYVCYHKHTKSKRRLAIDLKKRGIAEELIETVIREEYDQDEEILARALLEKRHYDPVKADMRERDRQFRFLVSKGFNCSLVKEVLSDS